jgi:hypothetical protein
MHPMQCLSRISSHVNIPIFAMPGSLSRFQTKLIASYVAFGYVGLEKNYPLFALDVNLFPNHVPET